MSRLYQAVRTIARGEAGRLRICELGVVKSVHPRGGAEDDHACTVELRDSKLVLPRVAVAVGVTGMAALPRVGDLVAVLFVGGDVHAPLIIGRLYHDELSPPEHEPDQVVLRLPPGSDATDERLDVVAEAPSAGDRLLEITIDGDAPLKVSLRPGELTAQVGDATLVLRQSGGAAEAEIAVAGARLFLSGNGEATLEAPNKLVLKSAEVEVQGDIGVKINGTTVELN